VGDRGLWVFERAVDRVESVVEEVVAGYVASYVGRALRRHEIRPPRPLPGIAWSIDGDIVVEFVHRGSAPDQLLVARHRARRRSQATFANPASRRHVRGDGVAQDLPVGVIPTGERCLTRQ
jgi:hypothetical protein